MKMKTNRWKTCLLDLCVCLSPCVCFSVAEFEPTVFTCLYMQHEIASHETQIYKPFTVTKTPDTYQKTGKREAQRTKGQSAHEPPT